MPAPEPSPLPTCARPTWSWLAAAAGARLIEKYGDTPMPDLLPELTKCPKWKSRAHYGGLEGDRIVSTSR
jgi:hypothetical protein